MRLSVHRLIVAKLGAATAIGLLGNVNDFANLTHRALRVVGIGEQTADLAPGGQAVKLLAVLRVRSFVGFSKGADGARVRGNLDAVRCRVVGSRLLMNVAAERFLVVPGLIVCGRPVARSSEVGVLAERVSGGGGVGRKGRLAGGHAVVLVRVRNKKALTRIAAADGARLLTMGRSEL